MEEGSEGSNGGGFVADTSKADQSMWLIKCPPSLSPSLRHDPNRPVATTLLLSIDPLCSNHLSPQLTMELTGNVPKCSYSMDMSQHITPLSVFCESSQGNIAVEGKFSNKFDMRPHQDSLEKNVQLDNERKNRYRTKIRQAQDALLEANEVFVSFKQENGEMAKSIKELKEQNILLKRKCEKSDTTPMELDEECEQPKKQLKESKNQKEELESLCRSLQAEQKQNSAGSSNSDSVPL